MASRSYSACSILKTCWLKCCCSFSFARLMQNCSKSFSLKHSKPGHTIELLFKGTRFIFCLSLLQRLTLLLKSGPNPHRIPEYHACMMLQHHWKA